MNGLEKHAMHALCYADDRQVLCRHVGSMMRCCPQSSRANEGAKHGRVYKTIGLHLVGERRFQFKRHILRMDGMVPERPGYCATD